MVLSFKPAACFAALERVSLIASFACDAFSIACAVCVERPVLRLLLASLSRTVLEQQRSCRFDFCGAGVLYFGIS